MLHKSRGSGRVREVLAHIGGSANEDSSKRLQQTGRERLGKHKDRSSLRKPVRPTQNSSEQVEASM